LAIEAERPQTDSIANRIYAGTAMHPSQRPRAEHKGYLAAIQTRDGRIQIISSRNHYVFNLMWLKALPVGP